MAKKDKGKKEECGEGAQKHFYNDVLIGEQYLKEVYNYLPSATLNNVVFSSLSL